MTKTIFCSKIIIQDMRDYAAKQGLGDVDEAITRVWKARAREFVKQGG
jgi:hypothetical protein